MAGTYNSVFAASEEQFVQTNATNYSSLAHTATVLSATRSEFQASDAGQVIPVGMWMWNSAELASSHGANFYAGADGVSRGGTGI